MAANTGAAISFGVWVDKHIDDEDTLLQQYGSLLEEYNLGYIATGNFYTGDVQFRIVAIYFAVGDSIPKDAFSTENLKKAQEKLETAGFKHPTVDVTTVTF